MRFKIPEYYWPLRLLKGWWRWGAFIGLGELFLSGSLAASPVTLLRIDFENLTNRTAATAFTPGIGGQFLPSATTSYDPHFTNPATSYALTRNTGTTETNFPEVSFVLTRPMHVDEIHFKHWSNHNFPTTTSYTIALQLHRGAGFQPAFATYPVNAANSSMDKFLSLGLTQTLLPGTYIVRWSAQTPSTGSDFVGLDEIRLVATTDTDGDGLVDAVETDTGIFVSTTDTGTDPGKADTDGDGINDGAEITENTNPVKADTDEDGFKDGIEVAAGTNPLHPAQQPVVLSAGWNHSLFLPTAGGAALAWGFNSDGRCGLGHANSPVTSGERITGAGGAILSNLVAVAAGGGHSLVLQANSGVRSLFASGANTSGQLGMAGTAGTNRFSAVSGPFTNPLGIAAGGRHSLVLDADGKVYSFGDNASGQLGQGGTTPVSVTNPTLVTSLANIQAIAAGTDHSLALTDGGQVYAWGRANGGVLGFPGISGIGAPRLLATNVTAGGVTHANGMTNLVQIVAGERHSLFLRGDGKVFASGVNSAGQLGLGSNVVSATWPTEVPIPGGVAIRRIAGGLRGSHALAVDGRVFAWGYNEYGELGLGTATTNSPFAVWTPTEVPALRGARQIASGTFQTFALDESGGLLAAGYNRQGQLGIGSTNSLSLVPAPTTEVGKTNQTITFPAPAGPFFVGGTVNLSAAATSGLPVAFFSSDTNRATVSGNTVTFRAAGTVTLTARQAGSADYNAAPPVTVLNLAISNNTGQSILFSSLPTKVAGDPDFFLMATASSGLPVSYSSSNTNVATVNGNRVTLVGPGTTTITASQLGNMNWSPATPVAQTLFVSPQVVFSTSRYVLVDGPTWTQAKQAAEALGGHLASIGSVQENDVLTSTFRNLSTDDYAFWIGGTDEGTEGTWRWVDGSPWTYARWYPGEPNNTFNADGSNRPENYASLVVIAVGSGEGAIPGGWNDMPNDSVVASGWPRTVRGIAEIPIPDTNAPVITLLGADPLEIYKGSSFVDPGATVTDNRDASRSIFGAGAVDVMVVGSYYLSYTAVDAAGNMAVPVTRTVNVVLDPAADEDGDGLTNGAEISGGTNPYQKDSDGDGVNDPVEIADDTNPTNATSFNLLSKDLIAFYPFSGDARDASGNGRHATVSNATLAEDRFGSSGGSFNCNSSTQILATLGGANVRTVSVWFKVGTITHSYLSLFELDFSTERYATVQGNHSSYVAAGSVGRLYEGSGFLSPQSVADGFWHHLVVSYDSASSKQAIYLDGIYLGLGTNPQTLAPVNLLAMGSANSAGNGFSGWVDEFKIYGRSLTPTEVSQLYSAGVQTLDSDGDGLTDAWERGYGRYQVITGTYNWDAAKTDAESKGGHLLTLTSAAERESMLAVLGGAAALNAPSYWIGGWDELSEGNWSWFTGEAWSFADWAAGNPDGLTGENHLALLGGGLADGSALKWNSLNGGTSLTAYILEKGYPTDPFSADTDGDGFSDQAETVAKIDPNDASEYPGSRTPVIRDQPASQNLTAGATATLTVAAVSPEANVLINSSFDGSTGGWFNFGGTIGLTNTAFTGSHAVALTAVPGNYARLRYSNSLTLTAGLSYLATARVRDAFAATGDEFEFWNDNINGPILVRVNPLSRQTNAYAGGTNWVKLRQLFTCTNSGSGAIMLVAFNPPSNNTYVVDNFYFRPCTTNGLSYQWQKDGLAISGATSPNLSLANLQTNQAGLYRVVVSSPYGSVTSAVAVLTVNKATPTISALPTASAITAGQALSTSTLSGGSASVPGTFAWTVPVLVPAASGKYSVTFTPTDTTNYTATSVLVNVSVLPANTPPTMGAIDDQETGLGIPKEVSLLSILDNETALVDLAVTASSSNTGLFSALQLLPPLTASYWRLVATPATGQSGEANITVTVTDAAGATAQRTFKLTVFDAYNTWARLTHGLTESDAAEGADPDGDGLSNLQEFEDNTHPGVAQEVVGYLGLIQLYHQDGTNAAGLGSRWRQTGGSNAVAEQVVFARVQSSLASPKVPVLRLAQPNPVSVVELTNRTPGTDYDEYEVGSGEDRLFTTTSEAEASLTHGTYSFQPHGITGGPLTVSNTVVWTNHAYPPQAPKVTLTSWSNNVLRIASVTVSNTISWEPWTDGTVKDQIRLQVRKAGGPAGGTNFTLAATDTSVTLPPLSLETNSVYECSLIFLRLPSRGAVRALETGFHLSTGPDFPSPGSGTISTFAPTNLTVANLSTLGFTASWSPVPDNTAGYEVEIAPDSNPGFTGPIFKTNVAGTTVTITNLNPSQTSWIYRVRAQGSANYSTNRAVNTGGVFGNAIGFFSTTPPVSSLQIPGTVLTGPLGPFTLAFWMKPAAIPTVAQQVVHQAGSSSGQRTFSLEIGPDGSGGYKVTAKMKARGHTSIFESAAPLQNPSAWNHIALVQDGASLVVFVNAIPGTPASLGSTSPFSASNAEEIIFGGVPSHEITSGLAQFTGQIDDIRLYRAARNQGDLRADLAGPASEDRISSMEAYYPLDETNVSLVFVPDLAKKTDAARAISPFWSPGRSPGAWDFASGDYVLQNDGDLLLLELGGLTGTTLYDQIFVRNGAATLDGIVNLMFYGTYTGPVTGSWHTFDLIWAQNGIRFGDNYQLNFSQPGYTVDTAVVQKDGGELWQATIRQAVSPSEIAQAAALAKPALGLAQSPGPGGSVEMFYTYTRPTGGSQTSGQYVVGGVRYEIQASTNLVTWTNAGIEPVSAVPVGNGMENGTVRVIGGGPRTFLRLKVSN